VTVARGLHLDLVFVTSGGCEPRRGCRALVGRAPAAGGILQACPPPRERLRVTERGLEIGVDQADDRPTRDTEQITEPLL
jgi:hypothetical protein